MSGYQNIMALPTLVHVVLSGVGLCTCPINVIPARPVHDLTQKSKSRKW